MNSLDLKIAGDERHERFLKRVVETGEVWGLKSENDDWPVSGAGEDETRAVMPFWSDRAYAAQCARDEWAVYEPTAIPLRLFLEDWLPGLDEDGTLVGTNWNVHLVGRESEPLDLLAALRRMLGDASP